MATVTSLADTVADLVHDVALVHAQRADRRDAGTRRPGAQDHE
ncbi:hypothetical protein AB0J63_33800 [Streptosporangium canum]